MRGALIVGGWLVLAGLGRSMTPAADAARAQEANGLTVWHGVFTDAQARRGESLYRRECASCHGDTLTGIEAAPALVGERFWGAWKGLTVGDFVERTRLSMPPTNVNGLSRQEYTDIAAFVLRGNGFPAGQRELDRTAAVQKMIRIDERSR